MHAKVQFCSPPVSLVDQLKPGFHTVHALARDTKSHSRRTCALCIALAGFIILAGAIAGEPAEDLETKARFLVNFAQFTEWPSTAFASNKAPLIIGILGADPFGKHLDKLAQNELVRGHHVRISRYRKVEEIKTCHILYISESEGPRLDRIIRTMKEKPVLTVSEIENSETRGVLIRMGTENKKISLAINPRSAKAAHLTLKSKLLRLGQIVEAEKK